MVKEIDWSIASEDDVPISFFEEHKDDFKHFGGDMESLLFRVKIEHAKRVFCEPQEEKKKIRKVDIEKAFEQFIKDRGLKEKEDDSWKTHLYL